MRWFKHDSNANMDEKLQEVLLDYGLEGYGLYWYCLELIVNKVDEDNLTFELKHDARIIARNTGASVQKVQEMMKKFIELGLFENAQGRITCLKLAKRLDKSMTSSQAVRNLIGKFKKGEGISKHHDEVRNESGVVMQEEKRIEENRIEHNKSMSAKADMLFAFWLETMDKSPATKKTKRRIKLIKDRLTDGYTVDQIKQAIINCSQDKFSMGMNDRQKPYNDIELICRNPEKLESFLENFVQQQSVHDVDWTKNMEDEF